MDMKRALFNLVPTVSRHSAVGTVGSRPYLPPYFPATAASSKEMVKQVQIQWKPVLEHLIRTLGGTEPVFTSEETSNTMFQMRVSFRLHFDSTGSRFEDIVVTGNKCFTVWEAESEAAAAALQKFEGRWFGTRIMDISRLRCEELEKKCSQLLVKAGELYSAIKLTFSGWEENMRRIDACCMKLSKQVVEDMCHGEDEIFGEIMLDVSDRLFKAKKANGSKSGQMLAELKEVKAILVDVKGRANSHFYIPSIDTVVRQEDGLPSDINLSMKIILCEMMNSIGWLEPDLTVTCEGPELYVCEIHLFPDQNYIAHVGSKIKITGPETSSEDGAVESGCKAAILSLESSSGICLVDLNYNSRSHAERFVSEAEYVVEAALSIGNKILDEWEMMVNGVHGCEQYCRDLAAKHSGPKLCDEVYHVKWECAIAADRLHKTCLSDLQLARRRFVNAGTWTDE